jgi:hypothetical protein
MTPRPSLPPLPARMRHLPVDGRGFPVPWFVAWVGGGWDFRVVDTPKVGRAWRHKLCWLCGAPLGVYKTAVIGPMCAINRVTSEPPSHLECADFAARACPHLTNPDAVRRSRLPADVHQAPGIMLTRNPGATCLWTTREIRAFEVGRRSAPGCHDGALFRLGEPTGVRWFARGRPASRPDIRATLERGLATLQDIARDQGPAAVAALHHAYRRVLDHLPPEKAAAA